MRDTGRVKRVLVCLVVLAACGGGPERSFDWDAALDALVAYPDRSIVADVAREWCLDDEIDDRTYQFMIAMSIDEGHTGIAAASEAGCSRFPAALR